MSDIQEAIKNILALHAHPERLSGYTKKQLLEMANLVAANFMLVDATREVTESLLKGCEGRLANCDRVSIGLPALINILADVQNCEGTESHPGWGYRSHLEGNSGLCRFG